MHLDLGLAVHELEAQPNGAHGSAEVAGLDHLRPQARRRGEPRKPVLGCGVVAPDLWMPSGREEQAGEALHNDAPEVVGRAGLPERQRHGRGRRAHVHEPLGDHARAGHGVVLGGAEGLVPIPVVAPALVRCATEVAEQVVQQQLTRAKGSGGSGRDLTGGRYLVQHPAGGLHARGNAHGPAAYHASAAL